MVELCLMDSILLTLGLPFERLQQLVFAAALVPKLEFQNLF